MQRRGLAGDARIRRCGSAGASGSGWPRVPGWQQRLPDLNSEQGSCRESPTRFDPPGNRVVRTVSAPFIRKTGEVREGTILHEIGVSGC